MESAVVSLEQIDVLYDKDRDVLYISFGPLQEADDSELLENDVIVRYKGQKVIGLTILSFSKRSSQKRLSS